MTSVSDDQATSLSWTAAFENETTSYDLMPSMTQYLTFRHSTIIHCVVFVIKEFLTMHKVRKEQLELAIRKIHPTFTINRVF